MKKNSIILVAIAILTLVVACKNKPKTREEQIQEFRSELTHEDTAAMLRICDDAMAQLKAKNIDQVLANLYEYDDSTKEMSKLSEKMNKRLRRQFKLFPVLDYKRQYFSFMLEGCNDVKYSVVFATAEQAGTEEAPVTMFMFNPIRVDGEWKLCVKTTKDEIDEEHL